MKTIDPSLGWRAAQERLDRTTNERHRLLLTNLRDHLLAEATADFDLLLSTLGENPEYHFWVEGSGFGAGPKGIDAVKAHYENLYVEGRDVLQYDIDRIVCDDDTIVTEGWFKQIYPGTVLQSRGVEVDDPSAAFLVTTRLTIFWPYDADGKLIGEDSYINGAMFAPENIEKLAPEDIPEAFLAKSR